MPAPRDVEERRTTAFERGPSEPAGIRELPSADGRPVVVVRLRECPACGLLQRLPPLPRGAVALCSRCGAVLRRRRVDPVRRSLALALTGLLLFALAVVLPFLDVNVIGRERETLLLTGPLELQQHGVWELAVAVLVTSVGAPLARLLALTYVLLGSVCRSRRSICMPCSAGSNGSVPGRWSKYSYSACSSPTRGWQQSRR
jgi:paraquat-inducible protein A